MMALCSALGLQAQIGYDGPDDVVDGEDPYAPFRTVYRSVETVDFNAPQQGSIYVFQRKLAHSMMSDPMPKAIKIEQVKSGVSASRDNSTVRVSSGKKSGGSVSDRNWASRKSSVDRQVAFMQQRQEELRQAHRLAAIREAERKRREKEAEDRKVAQRTAQVDAQLTGQMNQRIQKDYQNATVGRQQALSTSVQTANAQMQGPKVVQPAPMPKKDGKSMSAEMLAEGYRRRQRKARRIMYPTASPAPIKTPKPTVVRAVPDKNDEYVFTGRMTKTSIHIKKDDRFGNPSPTSAPRTLKTGKYDGFRLSPNAVVTTGQPIHLPGLEQKVLKSRPAVEYVPLTPEQEHALKMEELLPPVHEQV